MKLLDDKTETNPSPWKVLNFVTEQIPATKYFLGVVGLAAAGIIVGAFFTFDWLVALLACLLVFLASIAIVVYSRITKLGQKRLQLPAILLVWVVAAIISLSVILLFFSFFFGKPLDMRPPTLFGTNNLIPQNRKEPELTWYEAQKHRFKAKIALNDLKNNEIIKRDFKLLLACMIKDDRIDLLDNKDIEVSALYEITNDREVIVEFGDVFSSKIHQGTPVICHICLLKKGYTKNDFSTLSGLREIGGLVYGGWYETVKL